MTDRQELWTKNNAAEQWGFPNNPLQHNETLGWSLSVQITYIQTTHLREISQENK